MPTPVKPAKHADLSDVSTPHVLADLEAAVCSEGEADSKILTHKGDASAHHAKTTSFADITDRAGVTKFNWTSGKLLKGAGAGADPTEIDVPTNLATITFIIDGGGSAITTGQKGHLEIPFACTIQQATMLADQSGDIVVDIWKNTYTNFPPLDADSITSTTPPTISAAQKSQDGTLTGWTTAIAAGDILAFNVDSVATVTRVTISLKVAKS